MMSAMLVPDSGWVGNKRGFARPLIAGINQRTTSILETAYGVAQVLSII